MLDFFSSSAETKNVSLDDDATLSSVQPTPNNGVFNPLSQNHYNVAPISSSGMGTIRI